MHSGFFIARPCMYQFHVYHEEVMNNDIHICQPMLSVMVQWLLLLVYMKVNHSKMSESMKAESLEQTTIILVTFFLIHKQKQTKQTQWFFLSQRS
jgi:hypothetical protein